MLAALFDFVRDVAVLAAAAGIAWWCWSQIKAGPGFRDEAARASLVAERQAADLNQWAEKLDARIVALTGLIEHLAADRRDSEARVATRVRVHEMLQSTTDPFLTFAEIEKALTKTARIEEGAEPAEAEDEARVADIVASRNELRRVLIELVGDGVVAQMDRDRYFIASDFETGADEPEDAQDRA